MKLLPDTNVFLWAISPRKRLLAAAAKALHDPRAELVLSDATILGDYDEDTELQALLAERFQLKVQKENRPGQIYALTVAKRGPLLKPSQTDPDGDCVRPEGSSANRSARE